MSKFNSYSAIVSAVVEVAEDDSTEFLDYIPKAIELAQMRLEDELDSEFLNQPVELTCTPSSRLVLKPQGYRFINNAFIVTSGGTETPLKKVSMDYLREFAPNPTTTGEPRYYATDYSVDYIALGPAPASAYVLRTDMRTDFAYISAGNPSNILTEKCANALFFATMKEQAAYMKSPGLEKEFEEKYINAVNGINNRGRRDRRQDGGTASTTESGKNTLLGNR